MPIGRRTFRCPVPRCWRAPPLSAACRPNGPRPSALPGMGPESERKTHDMLLIGKGGGTGVFSRHPAA